MAAPAQPQIVLVSTYESGHQPLGLAAPAAALQAAGHAVRTVDLSVDYAEPEHFRDAKLVAISIPMHTAARLAIALARRVRPLNPAAHIAFYGLYASPLHGQLMESGTADSVIGGEYEIGLTALADRVADSGHASPAAQRGVGAEPVFDRQQFPVPLRAGLPPLDRYARANIDGELRLAGYVEASRGCAHTCTHCPITPVYGGRLRLVQQDTVLSDIDQQVAAGARHITFGDPDFLNARPHSMAIAEALHERHPGVTFDATIKVEHLIEHEDVLPQLRDLGCAFVTSAFESTNDEILQLLEKGHTAADMRRVLSTMDRVGLTIRPTWVAFTPWTRLEDILDMLEFVEEHGLVPAVQPVQYALRLLLPPGSPLVEVIDRQGHLTGYDEETLTYTWRNPDPRVDNLQAELAAISEAAASGAHEGGSEPVGDTFVRIKQAAQRVAAGRDVPVSVRPQPRKAVPGLTEAWFC